MAKAIINGQTIFGNVHLGEGGGELPSNYWSGTQAQYDSLSTYSDDTLYNILDSLGVHTVAVYIGNTLIYSRELDYDYYIEDVQMVDSSSAIDTGIKLFSLENINRDWECDFKINYDSTVNNDQSLFSTNDETATAIIIYAREGKPRIFCKPLISDRALSTLMDNKEVNIIKKNNALTILVDGNVILTMSFTPTSTNNNSIWIGRWMNGTPIINGYIEYFGFKFTS